MEIKQISENLDLIEHKLLINNQTSDTGSCEPLVTYVTTFSTFFLYVAHFIFFLHVGTQSYYTNSCKNIQNWSPNCLWLEKCLQTLTFTSSFVV